MPSCRATTNNTNGGKVCACMHACMRDQAINPPRFPRRKLLQRLPLLALSTWLTLSAWLTALTVADRRRRRAGAPVPLVNLLGSHFLQCAWGILMFTQGLPSEYASAMPGTTTVAAAAVTVELRREKAVCRQRAAMTTRAPVAPTPHARMQPRHHPAPNPLPRQHAARAPAASPAAPPCPLR